MVVALRPPNTGGTKHLTSSLSLSLARSLSLSLSLTAAQPSTLWNAMLTCAIPMSCNNNKGTSPPSEQELRL